MPDGADAGSLNETARTWHPPGRGGLALKAARPARAAGTGRDTSRLVPVSLIQKHERAAVWTRARASRRPNSFWLEGRHRQVGLVTYVEPAQRQRVRYA